MHEVVHIVEVFALMVETNPGLMQQSDAKCLIESLKIDSISKRLQIAQGLVRLAKDNVWFLSEIDEDLSSIAGAILENAMQDEQMIKQCLDEVVGAITKNNGNPLK